MRESEIETYLVRRVKELGGECRKVQWIGRRGAPDRVVFLFGQTLWIELKAPGEKLKPHQEREHQRMARHGCAVYTVDNIEQLERVLTSLFYGV